MSALEILKGLDNDVLRTKSEKVVDFNKDLLSLVSDMKDTMVKAKGIGIAAPQVGVLKRVLVVRMNHGTKHEMLFPFVNPEILNFSSDEIEMEEGCLSLPGQYAKVLRPEIVEIEFQDLRGNKSKLELDGWNSRIVQHEIDHLDGILFPDRVK